MRELERQVLLTVLDRKWREHLYEMDYLREGIGLRAMAQRDPLVEYQREGGDMFNAMMEAFMEEVVGFVFQVEVETPQVSQVTDADGNEVSVATLEAMLAAGGGENAPDDSPEPSTAELEAAEAEQDEREKEPATQAAAAKQGEKLHIRGGESRKSQQLSLSGPGEDGNPERVVESEDTEDEYAGTGRNQPCPCGSGKKYKQCHGKKGN